VSRAVVTGSAGFIGRSVMELLKREGHEVLGFDVADSPNALADRIEGADFIFHFAGSNRPTDPSEFEKVNVGLTERVCALAARAKSKPIIVLASSTQALLENAYGLSKRRAEHVVERFAEEGGCAVVFRLPNVFGPGCRPNYNSVVATFAHNAAHSLPLEVHDPLREIALVYVHDVARAMALLIHNRPTHSGVLYLEVGPVARITLGRLASILEGYGQSRPSAVVPAVGDELSRKLYATYLSYLSNDEFAYDLSKRSDERGSLAEFLKSPGFGQIFISRTRPGMTRGNHYHHTKAEKFLVVDGEAVIRFRRADGVGGVLEYPVKGTDFRVVDIPPDYTHSLENTGPTDLVVLFWASEIFNPEVPDTMPSKV
jgi:UDP-2-acetamido-2,6-beta-L-arabino-hexul-4-ose reductase